MPRMETYNQRRRQHENQRNQEDRQLKGDIPGAFTIRRGKDDFTVAEVKIYPGRVALELSPVVLDQRAADDLYLWLKSIVTNP